jgi:hypothetical protein
MSIFSLFAKPKPVPVRREATRTAVARNSAPALPVAEDSSWARRFPPGADPELTAEAMAWLDSLPESVKPVQLTLRYPRILNRLSLLACEPDLMLGYLKSLMIDDRGGRQGFPGRIPFELQDVYDHVQTTSGQRPNDPWALPRR